MQKMLLICATMMIVMFVAMSHAQVPLKGNFIAFEKCEANKKKTSDNPGNIRLEPLYAYEMIGRNSTPGTHYQVKVVGAPVTEARWVPMTCGAFAPQDQLVVAVQAAAVQAAAVQAAAVQAAAVQAEIGARTDWSPTALKMC